MYILGVPLLLIAFLTGVVMAFSPRRRKIGIPLALMCLGFAIGRLVAEDGWKQKFEILPDGRSEEEVKQALWWETLEFEDGKSPLGYSLRQNHPDVKKEVWCVAFFFPEQYAFGFDESGRLVARYHYISP
ncbi:hypothetical protein [Actomonas aquatica]|uniref:Uncharacterized protein n=1 Tax=Actomonas aquatica TaxID=2866162 RepID=A0ABZ1CB67_9BACT|nr:hypothetical protein [Opitutus sp. WL0086]WRQ88834.1 hypothetical protein K1X11_005415 [Opitutus sp. WL0086]